MSDHLQPLKGKVDAHTLAYIRRVYADLDHWFAEWDAIMSKTLDEESVLRKMLLADLHYAKLWVVCVALRGASWDRSRSHPRLPFPFCCGQTRG